MQGWGEFIGVFALFLASHAIPARPEVRGRLVAVLGLRGYLAGYIVVSVGLLSWLVVAAGRAPFVLLLPPAGWQPWGPTLVMPLACLLIAFGTFTPNPLSFGGRGNARFDPAHPGIAGLTRHPLLWALFLWAAAHALANPDLAHVLLFGGFAGFALLGTRIIDRRNRRLMGADWVRMTARTGNMPLAALLAGRWRPVAGPSLLRLAVAGLLWGALLWLHGPVIGVAPLP